MFSSRAAVAGIFLLLVGFYVPATATVTTIALTGGDASGISGGRFDILSAGAVNQTGQIVFSAQLQQGFGGVDPNDDTAVWVFNGVTSSLVAREGSGNVPGLAGANFQTFHDMAIDNQGDVVLRSTLRPGFGGVTPDDNQGLWKYSGGTGVEIARTGSGNVAETPNASYRGLSFPVTLSSSGQIVHLNLLEPVLGVINSNNDQGIWSSYDANDFLVAREETTLVPGVPGGEFDVLAEPRVNNSQEIVFRATLVTGGGVGPSNNFGIWKFSSTEESLLVRTGTEPAPGVISTSFSLIGDPGINAANQIAFQADLAHNGTVTGSNDSGVWLYTGTTGVLLARTGVGGVPELPQSQFAVLNTPLLSESGLALVKAQLQTGPGSVTTDDNLGLWAFDGVQSSLVARTGSGGVPGIAGASFFDFDTLSINAQGLMAVKASLQLGGGVTVDNDEGIWLLDSSGGGTLVAREGDPLAAHTISGLSFIGNSGGNDGRHTGLNDGGQLAFQANFADGDSGLFLFSTLTADFDGDGDVDSDDLTDPILGWEARYGNDLDGADFLAWQRQFGRGVGAMSSLATAVPEPATFLLFSVGLLALIRSRGDSARGSLLHGMFSPGSQ